MCSYNDTFPAFLAAKWSHLPFKIEKEQFCLALDFIDSLLKL